MSKMKEITIDDCLELSERFLRYCDQAEQCDLPILDMMHTLVDATISHMQKDQKRLRAMFRAVLIVMGEDYSEYKEDE